MKAIRLEAHSPLSPAEVLGAQPPAAEQALLRAHRMDIGKSNDSGDLGSKPFFSYPRIPGRESGLPWQTTWGFRALSGGG
ncbi:MAG: hypothetical protein KDA45_07080 [Planctomycetales bacterium]|nr:hypothetical protein [Planctomycetales bacterium]